MNVHGSYGARSYRDGRGRAGRKGREAEVSNQKKKREKNDEKDDEEDHIGAKLSALSQKRPFERLIGFYNHAFLISNAGREVIK